MSRSWKFFFEHMEKQNITVIYSCIQVKCFSSQNIRKDLPDPYLLRNKTVTVKILLSYSVYNLDQPDIALEN